MRRLGYLILIIVLIIILIPLVILQGIGSGIKSNPPNPSAVIDFSAGVKKAKDIVFDEKNNGGPKVKVFIVENNETREMYLEEYIRGVVAGEMPVEFEDEALKAQAVAARTYTVTRMLQYGGKGCSNHPGADICTDSTHCQEWMPKDERFKAWSPVNAQKNWDKLTAAIDGTKGFILTYDAAPVMYPMYFSTSGGKTENSQDIFSGQYPYLKSVVSMYEEEAPKYISKVTLTFDELINKFSQSEYKIQLTKSKIPTQIKITERTEGGSVKSIKVGNKTLTGMDIRKLFNLNSANFNIQFGKSDVTFTVMGYGHGVGMSQWGANGLAKRGKKFDEILKYYYAGTSISKIQDVSKSK